MASLQTPVSQSAADPADTAASSPDLPEASAQRHPRRWWVLAVLCVSILLVVVDNTIVNVALPTLSQELDASTTELQWIVDAYTLVFAALLLAFGHFGDRFGRKGALQVGLVIFGAMSVLAALSTTSSQLIGARALMGVGAALVFPATLAILVNVFTDRRERATAIGIWSAISGLAVAIGPVTGGVLLAHFDWGAIFLVSVPIVIIALIAGAFVIPTSKDPSTHRLDIPGLVMSVAAIGLLVWSIIEGPRLGWTSSAVLATGLISLALIAAFVVYERRTAYPLLDVTLFSNPRFSAASAAIAAAFFALFGFIFLITQFFQLVQGYTALEAGVRTLPFAVATGITSPLSIVAMRRFGSKLVVTAGLALMAGGFVVASTAQADSPYLGVILLSMIMMAVGLGLTTGPATEAIMGALPTEQAGVGSAVNDTTREIGGTLGVAIVGSVFASIYGAQVADALTKLGLPASVIEASRESVAAALGIAQTLPGDAAQLASGAASEAFMSGFSGGSLVAAAVAAAGALAAVIFLPARHRGEESTLESSTLG